MQPSSDVTPRTKPQLPEIETVDREIAGGFRTLMFAPALERLHEDETKRARERYFITSGQIASVLYNLFLLSDWQMVPDVFGTAVIVRIGIFTPCILIAWAILAHRPAPWLRESTSGIMAIISVALAMYLLTLSRSPDMTTYQYGSVLIMLFTAVVQRLRIRYAAAALVGILIVQIITIAHLHDMTPRLMTSVITSFVTVFVLLLWAAYSIEREQRRGYLLDLRSRILNDRLDRVAKQDALTGLWNRRHLETTMAAAWAEAQVTPKPMSVILLDIDHFKSFNDTYGHIEGDRCLQQIAASIRAAVDGDGGSVAVRFGGEEFLVFVDGADTSAAREVAEKIQAAIETTAIPHPVLGDGRIVTGSFGIATGEAPYLAPKTLVAAADDALYVSKRAGRNRIHPVVLGGDDAPFAGSDLDLLLDQTTSRRPDAALASVGGERTAA